MCLATGLPLTQISVMNRNGRWKLESKCHHGQQQSEVDSVSKSCVFPRVLQPISYDLAGGLEYHSILRVQ